MASTELNCCSKKDDVLTDQDLIEKNAVEIVKQMQRLRGLDGDYDSDSATSNRLAARKTIQNLERTRNNKKRAIGTLDVAFKKRFFALSGEDEAPLMDGQKQSSRELKFVILRRFNIFLGRNPHPWRQAAHEEGDAEGDRSCSRQSDQQSAE